MRVETEGLRLLRSGKIFLAERSFKKQIRKEQEPVLVSNAHFELSGIYRERAEASTFLSPIFAWLRVRHLQAATQYNEATGSAYYELAMHMHTERNLIDALQMVSRAVRTESDLLHALNRSGNPVGPLDNAILASMYCGAAAVAREAGEFSMAWEYLVAARSLFNNFSEDLKIRQATTWSLLCSETYLLLLAKMDWTAIAQFLRETLADGFLAEHDPDQAKLLGQLAIVFQKSEEANRVMSGPGHPSLMEFQARFYRKIGEAKTLDELAGLRSEILDALRSHEINGILRAMAEPLVRNLNRNLEQLTSLSITELPETPPALAQHRSTATGASPEARKLDSATRALWDEAREITRRQSSLLRSITESAAQATRLSIENIRLTCEQPYRPTSRERVSWVWLSMRRHSISILVSFVGLGVLLPSALDWHLKGSYAVACAFVGYVLDKPLNGFYERKLLSTFRRHLIIFLGEVCGQVWLSYNSFVERQRVLTATLPAIASDEPR